MQPNLRVVGTGEQSPVRRRPGNEMTLGFLLREAIKLARGRKDPTLLWMLHKCVERIKGESGNE